MISAVKNHPLPTLFGVVSLAVIGVAMAALAFPHFGAHLPNVIRNPRELVPAYLIVGGLGIVAGVVATGMFERTQKKRAVEVVVMVALLIATVASLMLLGGCKGAALQQAGKYLAAHKVQAAIFGSVGVFAALAIEQILKRKKT